MNTSVKVGGSLVAACAVCCAATVVPVLLAGTGIAALGGAAWVWGGALATLAAVAAGGFLYMYMSRRTAAPSVCETDANQLIADARARGCGCGSAAKKQQTPIACTLDAGDFKERTAEIRDLARRALRDAKRMPLTLTLTYAPEAADEVRAMMAKEQECCPFLTFGLKQTADAVELAIIAPPLAHEAADAVFDHFAPGLAAFNNQKEIA